MEWRLRNRSPMSRLRMSLLALPLSLHGGKGNLAARQGGNAALFFFGKLKRRRSRIFFFEGAVDLGSW